MKSIKGYKAFELRDNKLFCKDIQYSIEKIIELEGIFYYKKLLNITTISDINPNTRIYEIEDIGSKRKSNKFISVTNKIKLIKEINKKDYPVKFDNEGNKIYYKNCDGKEWFWKYDNQGNILYYKDALGERWFYEYDKQGKRTKLKIQMI